MAFSSKHILQRHQGSILTVLAIIGLFFFFYGISVLWKSLPNHIEIGSDQYAQVYRWYADEHARPLIVGAMSDGKIFISEYLDIEDALSNKSKLAYLIQEDN